MLNFLKSGPLMDPDPAPAGGGTPPPAITADHVRSIMNEVLAAWKPPVATAPPVVTPPVVTPPVVVPPVVTPPAGLPPGITPEIAAILDENRRNAERGQARIEALEAENKATREQGEAAARQSAVSDSLSDFDFHPASKAKYQRDVLARVTRTAEGVLVIGGLPVATVIKNELEGELAFYLKPKGVAGSGAGGGIPVGGKAVTLDDIKHGMTAETEKLALDRLRFLNSQTPIAWLKNLK